MKQMNIFDYKKTNLSKENINNPALLRDIPFDRIYNSARKEASRKKPAFFVHKYFARRITCNFRMMLLGSLLPYDEDIWDYFYDSFDDFGEDLVVLDPFMGGGTVIFESIRINAKTIGNDLQPLSNFVTSALIKKMDVSRIHKAKKILERKTAPQIMKYHKTCCPNCKCDADVMYSFHVKKVHTASTCKEHKLFTSFVLALKKDEFTLICPDCGNVFKHNFKTNGKAICKCGFTISDPKEGYVDHGTFKCKKCGEEHVVGDFSTGDGYPFSTDIVAIEYYCPNCKSHDYKKVEQIDREIYQMACNDFERLKNTLPIPDQVIPAGYNTNQILNHGYEKFSDLFNGRQLLCLGLLLKAINELEDDEAKFWFQLAFSGMLEMNNMFCRYQANAYKICNIFFNHAYVPICMPVENNVWGTKLGTGNFIKTLDKIIRGKKSCSEVYDISVQSKNGKEDVKKIYSNEKVIACPTDSFETLDSSHPLLHYGDSSNLSFIPDNYVDIVLTDPPFGANVMYSELIDFFHVWNYNSSLAKKLGFTEPFSPKNAEIIVNSVRGKTQKDYEDGLRRVFSECNKKLKDNGFLIFSFHDKSVESWISILNSIDRSGFVLAKAYPLHAETRTGAHTSNKNSIALDIMLICRKKRLAYNRALTYEAQHDIILKSYEETEEILNRLINIQAEITVPDVENIFISKYFSIANSLNISYQSVLSTCLDDVQNCVKDLKNYFSKYNISDRRKGWWSELYKAKWEV